MTQPRALVLANELLTDRAAESFDWAWEAGYELRRLYQENQELRQRMLSGIDLESKVFNYGLAPRAATRDHEIAAEPISRDPQCRSSSP